MQKDNGRNREIRVNLPTYATWDLFLDYIPTKHGKTYGMIGMELEKAITQYLEYPDAVNVYEMENIHKEEIEKLKASLNTQINQEDRLRNKYDHLQERFNKSQNE
jgi:hypothetical protein